MDSSKKIKKFVRFEALIDEIKADINDRDIRSMRYIVRFIMLNNFDEFHMLAKYMSDNKVHTLDIEDLMDKDQDDVWITKDTLLDAIKSCKQTTFVTPFSELARFYSDEEFRGFFNEIMLLEDIQNSTENKRIYIPLIGLENRFIDFLNHFTRINESAPIWCFDSQPQTVEVYLTKYKNIPFADSVTQCNLASLKQWLKFWKTHAPQNKIICTSKPIRIKSQYSKPDNIFNFRIIENAYTLMKDFLWLNFPFEYQQDEDVYWEQLLNSLGDTNLSCFDFGTYVKTYFNCMSFDVNDIIRLWVKPKKEDEFSRWLLKKYVQNIINSKQCGYLKYCMDNVTNLTSESLINNITLIILYAQIPEVNKQEYSKQRYELMHNNADIFKATLTEKEQNILRENITCIFREQGNINFATDLCTGIFDFEKRLLIGWSINYPDRKRIHNIIKERYPDYTEYKSTILPSKFDAKNTWAMDYINEYKKAKIKDDYTDGIKNMILDKNACEQSFYQWYYNFEDTHEALSRLQKESQIDKVFWIDGLGVEFLSYIYYLLRQENMGFSIVYSEITRSKLPTSTYHNRFDNSIKDNQLDKLAHDTDGYKAYDTLICELDLIKSIITDILSKCKNEKCNIAIVSDHGLSCLSRKVDSIKYEGKFEHEGRYIKCNEQAYSDSDYLVYKNEEEDQFYKIALKHNSLASKPTHQVHGGLTPEEVLVPLILISNEATQIKTSYKIDLLDKEIKISNPKIRISIYPQPEKVSIYCEDACLQATSKATNWEVELIGIQEGRHSLDIQINDKKEASFEITIIGLGANTNINDLMDF